MDGTRTRIERLHDNEARILARIVDAMLAAQEELEGAEGEDWSRILVDSCRRQKRQARRRCRALAAAC